MLNILSNFNIKDVIIVFATVILIICIFKIRKLKKMITSEVQKRLIPQLALEIDKDTLGMYIKNEGIFLVRDIKIGNTPIILDDLGYKLSLTMKFNEIDSLKPNESTKLEIKVFNKEDDFRPNITEKIIAHLLGISFKMKVYYSNIENIRFCVVFNIRQGKFRIEKIDILQPNQSENK